MQVRLPTQSRPSWLQRQGIYFPIPAALERLAVEGYFALPGPRVGIPAKPLKIDLLGFPGCQLTIRPRWIRPLRFVLVRVTDRTTLFDGTNLVALIAQLHRSQFERVARVNAPNPLRRERNGVR